MEYLPSVIKEPEEMSQQYRCVSVMKKPEAEALRTEEPSTQVTN